jgi:ribosomal protein L36
MNFTIFRSVQGGIRHCLKQLVTSNNLQINIRGIYQLCSKHVLKLNITNNDIFKPLNLLTPVLPQVYQLCGIKLKGFVKRYCKDCHFITRRGRLFVYCKKYSNHKQMVMQKKEKFTRILTFASQKKIRDW